MFEIGANIQNDIKNVLKVLLPGIKSTIDMRQPKTTTIIIMMIIKGVAARDKINTRQATPTGGTD